MSARLFLKLCGVAQALAILAQGGHAALQVPLMRNPSLAGTFVALTLFEWPWVLLATPAVALTTRHIPLAVLLTCMGVSFAQRKG